MHGSALDEANDSPVESGGMTSGTGAAEHHI